MSCKDCKCEDVERENKILREALRHALSWGYYNDCPRTEIEIDFLMSRLLKQAEEKLKGASND